MPVVAIVAISISLASTRDANLSGVVYHPVVAFVIFSINIRQTCLEKDIIIIIIIIIIITITCTCIVVKVYVVSGV